MNAKHEPDTTEAASRQPDNGAADLNAEDAKVLAKAAEEIAALRSSAPTFASSALNLVVADWTAHRQFFRVSSILRAVVALCALQCFSASAQKTFRDGVNAYQAGEFAESAQAFREAAAREPASGTLQNLGNAEWQLGRTGDAILAWEQALWLNPFDPRARNNLRFARAALQLDSPELKWYEAAATWLPANWWGWIAGGSLWLVVGMLLLPGILRWRKATWQQAVAALGLGVFLVSLPAHFGALTRTRIGFVLDKNTSLRLTPTAEGEAVTRLAAGEPARWVRTRGNYLFIRTSRNAGWIERSEFGLICSK